MDGLLNGPTGHRHKGPKGQGAPGPEPLFEVTKHFFLESHKAQLKVGMSWSEQNKTDVKLSQRQNDRKETQDNYKRTKQPQRLTMTTGRQKVTTKRPNDYGETKTTTKKGKTTTTQLNDHKEMQNRYKETK